MIGVSKLICDSEHFGDQLRYSESARHSKKGVSRDRGPVVAWTVTKRCNLNCIHCYMDADAQKTEEMSTDQAKAMLDELAAIKVPALLLSGGEPLMRPDIFEIIDYAREVGLRVTLSTNGTLIDGETADRLKEAQVSYVGISLDGIGEVNDRFRGQKGAYRKALQGIRNCKKVGQRMGLRFTLSRHNYDYLDSIFDLVEEEDIPRVCFYHLVYAGRGEELREDGVFGDRARSAVETIVKRADDFCSRGMDKEVLTVANHADVVYIYLWLKERAPERAQKVRRYLANNGGNRSGMAIANVDWKGNVHPDQFTMNKPLGNVVEEGFRSIWWENSPPLLKKLRDRKEFLQGRCARCRWLDLCNGNLRARAEAVTGGFWASDPGCYLSDEEIDIA